MPATPMFPLQTVLLPGESLPLRVFEPRYSAMVADCLSGDDPAFGVVLIARGREVGGGDVRHDVGALARITSHVAQGNGRYQLRCVAQQRFRVTEWLPDDPYPRAEIQPWPDEPGEVVPTAMLELEDEIWALLQLIASARGIRLRERSEVFAGLPEHDGHRLFGLAARVPMGPADKYDVLTAPGPQQRLAVLREAVETVTAMVRFQLPEGQ